MRNLCRKLVKFYKLTASEKLAVLRFFFLLLTVKLLLRILQFSVFINLYKKVLRILPNTAKNDYNRTAALINYASSGIIGGVSCLPKALVYKFCFRNFGDVSLIIGVQGITKGQFGFHAWVEKEQKILINHLTEESFTPLWEIN